MNKSITFFAVVLACTTACTPQNKVQAKVATTAQASNQTATSSVNGVTYNLSATPTATLQPAIARKYGIEQRDDTTLLLVSITDSAGNPVDPGAAKVTVAASIAPAVPAEVALRPIDAEGYKNLVGIITAKPPAKLEIRMTVESGGARSEHSFTRDILPR